MLLSEQIIQDYQGLKKYFEKLFKLLRESEEEEREHLRTRNLSEDGNVESFFSVSQFIKPDMLINIYSFLDFYAGKICDERKAFFKALTLSVSDIKGKNDLHTYHKYFTLYLGLDLTPFQKSYDYLQKLREVRNYFIHSGGHVSDENKVKALSKIDGIQISGTLIWVEDSFVGQSLEHAKDYLVGVARAGVPIAKTIGTLDEPPTN